MARRAGEYGAAMAIVPDDKDWTWVVQRPCPECGYDATSVTRERRGADHPGERVVVGRRAGA